jgi:hypothetical protein
MNKESEDEAKEILDASGIREYIAELLEQCFVDSVVYGMAPGYKITKEDFERWKLDKKVKRPWDIKGNTEPATKEEYESLLEYFSKQATKAKFNTIYTGEKGRAAMSKILLMQEAIDKDKQ